MSAIVGKKLGMTRVFDEDGTAIPVTVIEAAPNTITAIRRSVCWRSSEMVLF